MAEGQGSVHLSSALLSIIPTEPNPNPMLKAWVGSGGSTWVLVLAQIFFPQNVLMVSKSLGTADMVKEDFRKVK